MDKMKLWMEYQVKLNEKYVPVLHSISQVLKVYTSYKKLQDTATICLTSCCLASTLTLAETFWNFVEHYLKKDF